MPENSKYDVGATGVVTPRAVRINEMIQNGIKDGSKFTSKDMMDI